MSNIHELFTPYALSQELLLKNRMIMAPMTRDKANDDLSPTLAMAEYYARRADAGLIITEGTIISADTIGYKNVPGIYTQKHIDAWRKVTDAVHQHNGRIFLQIWHVGRVSHPHYLNGSLPISASATLMEGRLWRSENLQFGSSRAATLDEIKKIIENYATAASNAIQAGFDGVEIHGANGYLVDQFLHYDTNQRNDSYGQTPENMTRFALEVVKAVADAIGYQKTGLRISPGAYLNQIKGDIRDEAVFKYLLEELSSFPIAYVHTGNFDDKIKFPELSHKTMTEFIRMHYQGTVIASGGYQFSEAAHEIEANHFDLIALGRPFIANPDLIDRLQYHKEIAAYNEQMLHTLY
jgi:N-ethylmaleimide reductase